MEQQKTMKLILVAKIVLVTTALALHQGWIHIGDKTLLAEESKPGDQASKNAKDATSAPEQGKDKSNPAKDDAKSSELAKSTEDAAKAEEAPEVKKRRSFLSDLFELPKIDTANAKKTEIGKYLNMAERKEHQIDERVQQLTKREEELKAVEQSIDEKLGKLDDERKYIAQVIQQEKDLKGERLDKLVELFDKMDPKKAAPQFEKLDKDLTVQLFKRLKQKQVTTILEMMTPDKGVEMTEYFGRVKSAREYDVLKELNASLRKEFQDCKGMPEGDDKKQEIASPSKQDPATDKKTDVAH